MKKAPLIVLSAVVIGLSFLAGAWFNHHKSSPANSDGTRKVLYYVDPMNPSHTSDKPGLAPCGMKMEPVYADDASSAPEGGPTLPGTVRLSLEKQQLIGVRTGRAEHKAVQHTLRLLGRVTVDDTRSYQVSTPSEGWASKVLPLVAGSFVKKDETLTMFYSPTFISAGQAFRNALDFQDRMRTNALERDIQRPGLAEFNVKQYTDSLRNMGVSDRQINDMIRTRQYSEHIEIVSPGDGVILTRNVSQGQRFEKGAELYRIADLSRVWVVVDIPNREVPLVPPGVQAIVSVPAQNLTLPATLSDALPQFDNTTRTLKLRFEADNPAYALKPDMFVDVHFTINLPEALVVPAEAVLDSGLRKTVFVDRGNGYFEPRTIQTGWRVGDDVQVLHGLMDSERIVVSGNFLLDSESRMKLAASGVHGAPATDPVCGMAVDAGKAAAAGLTSTHNGRTIPFCNAACKDKFDLEPTRFLIGTAGPATPSAPKHRDPVCGMMVIESKARDAKRLTENNGKTWFFCNDSCKEEFDADPKKFTAAPNGN